LTSNIVNWEIVESQSSHFKNTSPTKWAFTEKFLNMELYEELCDTYPKFDDTWNKTNNQEKLSYRKFWKRDEGGYFTDGSAMEHNLIPEYDSRYSEAWNKFLNYMWSEEFIKKVVNFSGVQVTNLRHFCFMYARKDGFQMPHIHNISDKTLILFVYFSKNWEPGEPGGTYLSNGNDESKIFFEPNNLDNTALFVLDGPNAAHGMRKIIKNVERKGIQLTFEPYSPTEGWYGDYSRGKEFFKPVEL
tara:strand:- start:510 stop:1244 length:735 start_codon:yes stop_codon:yes gene_type:complete